MVGNGWRWRFEGIRMNLLKSQKNKIITQKLHKFQEKTTQNLIYKRKFR
jgi:hypothetical protein